MNDTQQFDPRRLRSITDMERSSDDRVIAGVCAGAAKYLNIDPVIVRVVLGVLTFAGFAGLILYVAAWLLLPADDDKKSILAEWLSLDKNEEQVRVAGLIGAAILAVLSIVGDSSWPWWGGASWWLLPVAVVLYFAWLRPRRERESRAREDLVATPDGTAAVPPNASQQKVRKPRERRSPALLALTASLAAIALAATWIYDETQRDVHWTTYLAVSLAVVGLGLLIGTFVGDGGPLIGIGVLLALALAVGSVFPSGRIGSQTPAPTVAADVESFYKHGIGQLELDLTQVTDPIRLGGRTITLDAGIGQTRVIVPDGLKVDVDAHLKAGEVSLFGRRQDGTNVSMADAADSPGGTAVSIRIDQQLGQIEVISR